MKKSKCFAMFMAILLVCSLCLILSSCKFDKYKHTHEWLMEWSNDAENHWHKCKSCEEIKDKAKHTYTSGICVCGKSEGGTEENPSAEVLSYSLSEDGSFAICNGFIKDVKIPTKITIANEYEGKPVKEIGRSAFAKNTEITNVILGENIEIIRPYAFQSCTELKNIKFSNILKSLGECALSMTGLKEIIIPESVDSMETYVFWKCANLVKAEIASPISELPLGTFNQCPMLEQVKLPDSITIIGEECFRLCTKLTTMDLPKNISEIRKNAFRSCEKLTDINLHKVTKIGEYTFAYSGLQNIDIPETLVQIGDYPFYNSNLTSVNINCKEVFKYMFYYCLKLKNISFGENTEIIRTYAFYDCIAINELVLDKNIHTIEEGIVACNKKSKREASVYSLTLGSNVQNLPLTIFNDFRLVEVCNESSLTPENNSRLKGMLDCTLNYCTNRNDKGAFTQYKDVLFYSFKKDNVAQHIVMDYLGNSAELILPEPSKVVVGGESMSEYSIANYAFDAVSRYKEYPFTKVVLPNGVTQIGAAAFRGMSGLKEVSLGNVKNIKGSAFSQCGLTELTLPESVVEVAKFAFGKCENLTTLNWNAINCRDLIYDEIRGENAYVFGSDYGWAGYAQITITNLNFGSKVEKIPAYMFSFFDMVEKITIPASVNYIGKSAFHMHRNNADYRQKFIFEDKRGWTVTGLSDPLDFSNDEQISYLMNYVYGSYVWNKV